MRQPDSRLLLVESRLQLVADSLKRRQFLRRRKRMVAEDLPTLAVVPNDEIGMEILHFGLYERRLLSLLFDNVLAPYRAYFAGKTALDIGANIGNHALYMSRRFGRIIAFEPGFVARHLLAANIRLNDASNIDAHSVGLSDRNASATLVQQEASNLGSSAIVEVPTSTGEIVELRRGDDVLRELHGLEPVALIKIDVEGHEIFALRGLSETLRRDHPVVLFETYGKYGERGSDAILSLLRSCGYENFYTVARDFPLPSLRHPIARGLIRVLMGARFVLQRREALDDRYYNLVIAAADPALI